MYYALLIYGDCGKFRLAFILEVGCKGNGFTWLLEGKVASFWEYSRANRALVIRHARLCIWD